MAGSCSLTLSITLKLRPLRNLFCVCDQGLLQGAVQGRVECGARSVILSLFQLLPFTWGPGEREQRGLRINVTAMMKSLAPLCFFVWRK